jgi:glycine/D-amino acid oxidase-like deaminating enzyme
MLSLPWPKEVNRAILYSRDCYLLTRGDEAVAGSTMEYAGFRCDANLGGLEPNPRSRGRTVSSADRLDVRRTWAGLRPMTPDGLPLLGPEPRLRGLWYATGHGPQRHPAGGDNWHADAPHDDGQQPTEDLSALKPERFWNW